MSLPCSLTWLPASLHSSPCSPRLFCSRGSFQTHPNCSRAEVLAALACHVLPQLLSSEQASPSFLYPLPVSVFLTAVLLLEILLCQSSLCCVFQPQLTTGLRQVQVEQPGRNTHVSKSVFRAITKKSEMQAAGPMYKKQVSVLKVRSLWSRQGMDLRPG